VCPVALLTTRPKYFQSLGSPSHIPQDDDAGPSISSEENSCDVGDYEQYHKNSDLVNRSFLDVDPHSQESPMSLKLSQVEDRGAFFETDTSNMSSPTQLVFTQKKDSSMLTKSKPLTSLHKTLSKQSLQKRLGGKSDNEAIDHIQNILRFSFTNSWRSSVVSFASSWKSRGSSLLHKQSAVDDTSTSTLPKLSHNEQISWDELVDETKLAPSVQSRPTPQEISLNLRPCCAANEDLNEGISCSTCGFSSAHYNGKHCVELLNQGLGTYVFSCFMGSTDRFGNTPLHFAAASADITTTALKSMITSTANIKARNTSGEYFMHVLNITSLGGITEYLGLLRFLKDADVQFSSRDIHGRSVAHKFFEKYKPSEISIRHLEEIFRLLQVDVSAVDNVGYDFGLSELISGWGLGFVNAGDRRHSLLRRHSNPVYLKVDYRATLLSLLSRRVRGLPGIELVELGDWLNTVKINSLSKWVDVNGDTPLTALVRYYPEIGGEQRFRLMLRCLLSEGCDINARDRQGYTAVAIATRRGQRPVVSVLLENGAAVNIRSYHGTSTMSHAAKCLHRAQERSKERMYGMILSCISLIADKGAKTDPSVYDEFSIY
jgi:ankyrin repeat protein